MEEMRADIIFINSEGVKKPAQIIRRMQQQCGESCLCRSKVYEGIDRFKNAGFLSVTNSGKAFTSRNNDNSETVNQMIRGYVQY